MKRDALIRELLDVVAKLRSPQGCPWDRKQDHMSLRFHVVEEVYELVDAIESGDDHELEEELGDMLLHVVLHSQLAKERRAFDFDGVVRRIVKKLIHRHPHVFGAAKAASASAVLAQWDRLKHAEKAGTRHARDSALDGIARHLPALLRAEKLLKKAKKAGLWVPAGHADRRLRLSKASLARELLRLAEYAQRRGWSAEGLLRLEAAKLERKCRRLEARQAAQRGPRQA